MRERDRLQKSVDNNMYKENRKSGDNLSLGMIFYENLRGKQLVIYKIAK